MTEEFVNYSGPIVTRTEARKAGLVRYFTGKVCQHGHLAERYTKSKKCVHCKVVWHRADVEGQARRHKREVLERNALKEAMAGSTRPEICDICGETDKKIRWDHCHYTGIFRGWICTRCNCTFGYVKDSPELLRKMADYLENNGKVDRKEKKFSSGINLRWARPFVSDS